MTFEEALAFVDSTLLATQGKRLNPLQKAILQGAWFEQKYAVIAETAYCTEGHVKDVAADLWQQLSGALGTRVGKKSLRAFLEHQQHAVSDRADWGDAPDAAGFIGRADELQTLGQWLLTDHCRLVTILGMGGIGKTALAAKVAHQFDAAFERIVWRSLRNAPAIDSLLTELITALSDQSEIDLSNSLDGQLLRLLEQLRARRCLLILDNVESILPGSEVPQAFAAQQAAGNQAGYAGYRQLLTVLANSPHDSCLLLTSREKPQSLAPLEGTESSVRSLTLKGLSLDAGREMLQVKGNLIGSDEQWQTLFQRYGGNPLALKIVASAIAEFFDHNLAHFLDFLKQGPFIFDDVRTLLSQQFERLSAYQQEIMYWLAINRGPTPLTTLQTDFAAPTPTHDLFNGLATLQRRSLIEKATAGFSQQPVVMEYLITRLTQQVVAEISTGQLHLFHRHALVQAEAQDDIYEAQTRLILQPIAKAMMARLGTREQVENVLKGILRDLQSNSLSHSYAAGNLFNLLRYWDVDLSGYSFSALPVWQADGRGLSLCDTDFTRADLSKSVFSEPLASILAVAISPDGHCLATGDIEGQLSFRQVPTGQPWLTVKGHQNWVRSIAFSPDGDTVATGSYDQTIKLWEVKTGQCLQVYAGHDREVHSVAFSPDGKTLVSGSADQTLKRWQVSTGECLHTYRGHHQGVSSVAFSPDGKTLVSGSADHTLKQWQVSTGECLHTYQSHHQGVSSVAFSPDGKTLVSGSADRTLKLWQVSTGACLHTYHGHTQRVYSVAFHPDGQTLASSSADQTVKLWGVDDRHCLKTYRGHTQGVFALAFSPVRAATPGEFGATLASGSFDQTLKLWHVPWGRCIKTCIGHRNGIFAVALSPDGCTLASSDFDQGIKLWDLPQEARTRTLSGHRQMIWSLVFDTAGKTLFSASADHTLKRWHIETGECLQTYVGHRDRVYAIALSREGLISGSGDRTVKVWDIDSGLCRKTLTGHDHSIFALAITPDGRTLASGGANGTICLWDVGTGACLRVLAEPSHTVWSVAFSPDGHRLASGSADNSIYLWDIETGECLQVLQGHQSWVSDVTFGQDASTLISSSADGTLKIWDIPTGHCLNTLTGHRNEVYSIALSADGQTLASASQDETIRLWHLSTGECLHSLRAARPYEGMKIEGATGLSPAQITNLKSLGAIGHPAINFA